MADMAAVAHKLAFVDFPHDAVTVGTGEYRPTADAIHFMHATTLTTCDVDFVFEAACNRLRFTCGFAYQFFEQRRHPCEADDMIGLRTQQRRSRHFRKSRIARVLYHCDAAGLLQRLQACGAVSPRPRGGNAPAPPPTAQGRGPKKGSA